MVITYVNPLFQILKCNIIKCWHIHKQVSSIRCDVLNTANSLWLLPFLITAQTMDLDIYLYKGPQFTLDTLTLMLFLIAQT